MVVTDIVEEEPAHPAKKGPVNRGGSTAKERPFSLPVVGNCGIRMVQIREHD